MSYAIQPRRGDIWLADLDPIRGTEQAGQRPVLILSVDRFNRGPSGRVIALPLSTRDRGIPWHIPVAPPAGGLRRDSVILCDQMRALSTTRLVARWGQVEAGILAAVGTIVRRLLGLEAP